MIALLLIALAAAAARRHRKPDFSAERLDAFLEAAAGSKQELDLTDQSLLVASEQGETSRLVAALNEAKQAVEQEAPGGTFELPSLVANEPLKVATITTTLDAAIPVAIAMPVEPVVVVEQQPAVAVVAVAPDQPVVEPVVVPPSHDALMARAFDLLTKIDLAIARKSSGSQASQALVNFLEQLAELVSA